jgi:hypothetical protein
MTTKPNNLPNFTQQSNIQSVAVTAANTSSEGGGTVGTSIFLAFTPGANDSFIDFCRWMPTASSAATSTQATVGRIFVSSVNTGSTTSSNTYLVDEVVLPSVSADSSTVANNPLDRPMNFRLNGSANSNNEQYLLCTNHAAPTSPSQWILTTFGSDY